MAVTCRPFLGTLLIASACAVAACSGDAATTTDPPRGRGNGNAAWRFITGNPGGGYIETLGAERTFMPIREDNTNFIRATWNGSRFQAYYKDLTTGQELYNFGKNYTGVYQPFPLVAYVGSPWVPGERGEPASYEDMIVRQVWLSPNPRPAFANK